MVKIIVNIDGKPSPNSFEAGNQWENLDQEVTFSFPEAFSKLYKYVVARTYKEDTKENITRVFPLVKNKLVIGSSITCIPGTWYLYTLCKSSEVNLDTKTIDLRAQKGEHISISDVIVAKVNANDIDAAAIENIEIDPNIKILYDELFDFKAELENNEAARQTNESLRKQAEVLRVNAEIERAEAESDRNDTEIIRVDNENARKQAEAERVTNENQRIKSEQSRQSAESSRVSAESTRIEVEKTRINAESQRATVESSRVSAESKRVETEKARVNVESQRVTAESSRTSAEAKRVDAEKARANAESQRTATESSRVSAESNRSSAERQRAEAETSRINAEQSRADAEQLRVSAENERVTAENARAEAESKREGVISKLREDLDNNTKLDQKTVRSLTALWDLNKGISYRFEEDNKKAYHKQVPSGAKLGALNKIGGRTIVYNQLFKTDNIDNGSITITYADNIVTINGTTSNNWVNFSALDEKLNVVGKFYVKMIIIKNDDGLSFKYGWLNRNVYTDNITSGSASAIHSQTSSDLEKGLSTGISWAENTGSVTFNDVKIQITIVNLTKMFGEGNEPSTVEEFESMFPNSYYPYNEGELMSMSVNEVEEVGKNIFKCKHFSCEGIKGSYNLSLNNSYGTSINNTEPSNSVMVTQSSVGEENINTSYKNGYFCVSFKPFVLSEDYMLSFDVIPSKNLIENSKVVILLNGTQTVNYAQTQDLQVGKRIKLHFNLTADNTKVVYIEFRNSGISGVFENFQIERGSTNTSFSPYHEKAYPITQAIQNLDGYGWSVGNIYNYVDYENKKFYKYVNRVDLGTFTEIYVYSGLTPSDGRYVYAVNISDAMVKGGSSAICELFNSISYDDLTSKDGMFLNVAYNQLLISTNKCKSVEELKAYINNKYLYYELAELIVMDISGIIEDTFQEPINVESGGSLTFKNTNGDDYRLAVPSDVQYTVKLNEVTP